MVAIIFILFLASCITSMGSAYYAPRKPVVYTKNGPVVGLIQLSNNNREYSSFRGIPYAKPPIGELRFKAPEPLGPWEFAVNATKEAPYCIQINYLFANPHVEGQEDCLYLNVYVPNIISLELLPVFVFIHWGAFTGGRGSSDILGPEYIMDKDVILVTFNYRLGVFGFFSTLDDAAPGNIGLKDQAMVLKWVHENICYFGGDRNRVTLGGQSAGAGSTSLHLVSPLSRGLFQQAISMSGVSLNLWAKPFNSVQPQIIGALALLTGCQDNLNNSVNLVKCLRRIDATSLAKTADKFKFFSTEPLTPYTMVVETQTLDNPNPFLIKEPLQSLQENDFVKVPWIVGVTQDEGILRVAALVRQSETLRSLNANFSNILPQLLYLQASVGPNVTTLYDNILQQYLGGKPFIDANNPQSVQGFIDLYTDRAFVYGIYQAVVLQSKLRHYPIWIYNFNYRGALSYGDKFAATNENINFTWGVSHCDDLLYLFKTPALFQELQNQYPADIVMRQDFVTLITNFIIYGDPDPFNAINWMSLSFGNVDEIHNADLRILNITGSYNTSTIEFKNQFGFYSERIQFWLNQALLENIPGIQ